jgi:cytochrome c biogenesis protein CcmG/thiol:disulfide interchange protein DsbE
VKRWFAVIPLAVLVLVAFLFAFFALTKPTTRVEPDFTVGKPALDMLLPHLEGGPPVSVLSEIKGPALVNLFGSWCIPCAAEAPFLADLQGQGIRIVGLDEGQRGEPDPQEDIAAFLRRFGNPYAVILSDA